MVYWTGWMTRFGAILKSENKGPWGSGGSGDGEGSGGNGGGPRNPWQFPPEGRRRSGSVTSLDDFLKRARRGGGGPGGDGSGGGGFQAPGGRGLWIAGIVVIIAVWLVFTCFHIIGPQQRGVVTTFGNYTRTLGPGVKMTLPAPIESVQKVDVEKIREDSFPKGGGENLVLTGDQNIVDLSYQVRWNVSNPQNYVFQIRNPEDTVRAVAESAMREELAEVSLDEAIGAGRSAIEGRAAQRMQQLLNEYQAGVAIQGVAIKNSSPPAEVDEAFKKVTAAQQDAQANINQARAYAQQILAGAQGEAAEFDKIYAQYKLAPDVTRRRLYYETMEKVLAKSDKTIVEPRGVVPYLPMNSGAKSVPAPTTGDSSGGSQAQGGGQ
ncbi:FtsH protease activity modulator HflK [Stakelama pacifica]|uniref:Protein HflK n=1 Tax=Stakelama pacifica TaxID=517720 RepID=A0A4R6FW15_9SPHN|nr:FtsH protease activity modulator HflK [Stakelama pacifica]TDN85490.1 protease FtsH subunit HflK [Stakelama pacifica]GGO92498.1 protease modulator HflK [Stakelama pacifica]